MRRPRSSFALAVSILGRGRDAGRPAPPARIRTSGITASGSCLGSSRRTAVRARGGRFEVASSLFLEGLTDPPTQKGCEAAWHAPASRRLPIPSAAILIDHRAPTAGRIDPLKIDLKEVAIPACTSGAPTTRSRRGVAPESIHSAAEPRGASMNDHSRNAARVGNQLERPGTPTEHLRRSINTCEGTEPTSSR